MGITLSLIFAVLVIGILLVVWMINGGESRKNARAAAKQLRDARTVDSNPRPERGTGID